MKKLDQMLSWEVPAILLRKDDLQEILSAFENGNNEVSIRDTDCEYSSLTELCELKKDKVRNLKIFNGSGLSFSFDEKYGVELSAWTGDKERELAFYRICNYLKCRANPWSRLANPLLPLCIGLAIYVCAPVIPFLNEIKISLQMFFALVVVAVLVGSLAASLGMKPFNSVRLVSKSDDHSFLQRNKDKILLAVLSALIGAVVTFFLEKLK